MERETAMEILKESHKAQEILFSLFDRNLCEKIKEDKNRNDLEGKVYKGIFTSYHTIMNSIQDEIFKEFPNIKEEFHKETEKCSNLNNIRQ